MSTCNCNCNCTCTGSRSRGYIIIYKRTRQVKVSNAEHFHTCELRARSRAQRTEVGVSQTLDTRGEGVRDRQEPQPFDFLIFFENPEGLGLEERKAQTPKKTPATPEIRLPKSPDAPPQQRMFKELGICRRLHECFIVFRSSTFISQWSHQ